MLSVLLLLMLVRSASAADDPDSIGFWDILPESIVRPMSFVGFVGGSALFVTATPFIAVASLEPPHDAWSNAFNGFIGAPIRYTFERPIGDYRFDVYPDESSSK